MSTKIDIEWVDDMLKNDRERLEAKCRQYEELFPRKKDESLRAYALRLCEKDAKGE